MITLSASGGSVTFEFSGNSTYLNDGQITVPVNSLALIIDESDMAAFLKAASNDIFVSANIAEFGMTKAELESWYKANMVGSTGGGGGVTPGEVQTMIDESISGKADTSYVDQSVSGKANSSDVYTTGQTSGATEIANALNAKLDATAYTPTDLSEYWTSAQTSSAIDEATSGKTNQSDFTAYTASTDAALSGKVNVSDNVVDAYSYYIKTDDYSNPDYTYDSGIITIIPEYCHKLRIKLKGSLGNSQLFYRLRVGIEDVDSRTNIKSYLTVTSNEDGKFSSASLSSDTYCTATVDTDGILWLEGKNGYGFTDFRTNTSNTIEVIPFPYYDVESGQTADVLNDSVVKNINVLKNVANGLSTRIETPYENGLSKSSSINVTTSGLTFDKKDFKNNTTYNVIPLDESLGYNNSLGVYATGATHSNLMNANTATNGWLTVSILFKPLYQVTLALNQSFTGTVSTSQAIRAYYFEGSTQRTINWDYDSVNDSFTNTTSYTGITLTYDNVAKVVTLTLDSSYPTIEMFGTNWSNYIAPINDLTNADCWIGAVTVNTNLYKLQEALDNKVDASDVTTAVTSGSTDVVTSGGVYAKMGGMTIVKITESDYQSLSVKDLDTLYVVIPDPTNP